MYITVAPATILEQVIVNVILVPSAMLVVEGDNEQLADGLVPPAAEQTMDVPSPLVVQVTLDGNVIVMLLFAACAANPKVATPTATPTRSKVLN